MANKAIFTATLENFVLIPKLKRTHKGRFSPAAKKYHANQNTIAWEFKKASMLNSPINYPIKLTCSIYLKDKKRKDLGNLIGSIEDALVKAGVIKDDNTTIISQHNTKAYHGDVAKIKVSLTKI